MAAARQQDGPLSASEDRAASHAPPIPAPGGRDGGAEADVYEDSDFDSDDADGRRDPPDPPRGAVGAAAGAAVGWSASRLQRLYNSGGFASRSAKTRRIMDEEPPSQEEVSRITTNDVNAVFGRDRAATLRVTSVPMQLEQVKHWKFRNAQQRQFRAAGMHVPDDFNPAWFFYTFQFDRRTLLATAPIKIHDLEQWLWMHSRWAIADVNDMTKQSDFLHVMAQVDLLSVRLTRLNNDLVINPSLTATQSLRDEFSKILFRFTTIRSEFVVKTVADALSEPGLAVHHEGLRILSRVYGHDAATLPTFLRLVYEQINTQSAVFDDEGQREGFVCRSFLSMARAFVGGLKGGTCPQGPNPLDSSPPVLTVTPVSTSTLQASPLTVAAPPASAPPTAGAPASAAASNTTSAAGGIPISSSTTFGSPSFVPPPCYQTVTNPAPGPQLPDLETCARQVAAGYREAGPLYRGWGGGGQDGVDLTPNARRVLHAFQVQAGERAIGALHAHPPTGALPALSTYQSPFVSPGFQSGPGFVSPVWGPSPNATPAHSAAPSPYSTMRRDLHNAVGGSLGQHAGNVGQRPRAAFSDELYIPYSAGLLGSYSPYRGMALPNDLTCFECHAAVHHFGAECPTRFARVRGEVPPGWKIDGPGAVSKNPAAWNGTELTDAARAEYRGFVTRLSLVAHGTHPVTVDEITGAAPPAPRRPLPRADGAGRRK